MLTLKKGLIAIHWNGLGNDISVNCFQGRESRGLPGNIKETDKVHIISFTKKELQG